MQINLAECDKFSFLDPASGKKFAEKLKDKARSALVTIAVDRIGRVFVIQAWADRVPTTKLIDKVFEAQRLYQPRRFGCEAGGMQSILTEWINAEKRQRGVKIPLIPVAPNAKIDKDWAIRTALQPLIANGRLFIQKKHFELKSEIMQHPQGRFKDLLDALRNAVALVPRFQTPDRKRFEAEKLRDYLERCNLGKDYIRQRLNELDLERD